MKRVCHHYKKWEDYKAGFYNKVAINDNEIKSAKDLLEDKSKLQKAMTLVLDKWPIACEQNLTDKSRNRRAWLGQAACCLIHGVAESITKLAWRKLKSKHQLTANNIADNVINNWELNYYCPDNQLRIFK